MGAKNAFDLSTVRADAEVTVRARGEMDFSVTSELMEAIESALDDSVAIVNLDCEQVTFIDSEAIKTIMIARRNLGRQGKLLLLSECSRTVTRLLSLLNLKSELIRPPSDPIEPFI